MEHNEIKESIKKDFFNMNGLIGTTGREQEVIRYCRNIVQDYADDTEVMDTGNLIATFYGNMPGKTVMISAHTDEVGYIVKNITESGFILFEKMGGANVKSIPSHRMLIQGSKGVVVGIVGITPGHIQKSDEEYKVPMISDSYIDVGASLQNDRLVDAVKDITDSNHLPVQFTTMAQDRYGGDAMAILRNGNQRPCLTLTIPRRYSHSPSEVADLNDAEVTYEILMNMVERDIKLEFL